jgi:hypothetical protein
MTLGNLAVRMRIGGELFMNKMLPMVRCSNDR